jgi:mannose-6-phosphate isomerase
MTMKNPATEIDFTKDKTPLAPFRLNPFFSERVWGRPNLKPWYADTGTTELVGEAWLTGPQCTVEKGELAGQTLHHIATEHSLALLSPNAAPEFPLLVKMLFPNDKLSVQVHPDDSEAQALGQPRGKTECWYVLEADPGATVALGLKPGTTLEALEASAHNATMESLLEQVPVEVGDMVFVDAGTVHAIGHGVVLLETQQTCDITYRLYDYGRPRELHLEQGLKVAKLHTAAGKVVPQQKNGFTRLIEQKYFTVDRFDVAAGSVTSLDDVLGLSECLISIAGSGIVKTNAGEIELVPGEAVVIPASSTTLYVDAATALSFVRCFEPRHA